jgi:excisionase family DNA binding protein
VIALYLERLDAAHLLAAVRAYRGNVSNAPAGLARLENVLRREVEGDRNGQQATGTDATSELAAPSGYGQDVNGALLTVAEVARLARLSERTVRRRIADGELPAVRLGTGPRAPLRIGASELAAFVESHPAGEAAGPPRSPRGGLEEEA